MQFKRLTHAAPQIKCKSELGVQLFYVQYLSLSFLGFISFLYVGTNPNPKSAVQKFSLAKRATLTPFVKTQKYTQLTFFAAFW